MKNAVRKPPGTERGAGASPAAAGELELAFLQPVVASGKWGSDNPGGLPLEAGELDPSVAEALGVEQARAAAEFAAHQGLEHAVPVANGTRALVVALMAASVLAAGTGRRALRPGGKVLVAGLTWQAGAMAPIDRGLVPVLVDVDPRTGVVDAEVIESALREDPGIVAVVLPHLYCRMVDMPRIAALCEEFGVVSVEDCAHAHGGRIGGRAAGAIADLATWSFQGSKSVSCGEGGMVTTRHAGLVDQLVSIVTCGRQVGRSQRFQAGNERLGALQAALLRAQLRRFYRDQLPVKQRVLREFETVLDRIDGVSAPDPQPAVDQQITYKALALFDPSAFGRRTAEELAAEYQHLLGCEVTTLYDPLNDSALYRPDTDPANHWSPEFVVAVEPSRFELPGARALRRGSIAFEHSALLDEAFPGRFQRATEHLRSTTAA
ncbi:DegT/DnrJ/EryC1/StrS family aminotransferase [Saccharopolyspora indica]|uniref:DegT/DnrJ/EryC1/StrS family aminotransferase n=1 Tax=Saccharopolyspora indica TaxID=1229659 RepID=UPI0022EB80C2|nr:DegT/DnrJ/EryC1/StrS family aminotransferase [Saccharopolyspora indica]MDA3642936.1 DegT/DnrJ/EryC1/StrS family aminotransferase [Saccharopolyspora indica]